MNSTMECTMLCGCIDHVHLAHRDVEQPARLDHLQAFVEERGRIDRDLPAHVPGGMLQRLLDGDLGELRFGSALRETVRRDAVRMMPHEAAPARAVQALENGVVLAVHGQHAHALARARRP